MCSCHFAYKMLSHCGIYVFCERLLRTYYLEAPYSVLKCIQNTRYNPSLMKLTVQALIHHLFLHAAHAYRVSQCVCPEGVDPGAGLQHSTFPSLRLFAFWKEMLGTRLCQVLMTTKDNKTGDMGIFKQMIVFLTFFG